MNLNLVTLKSILFMNAFMLKKKKMVIRLCSVWVMGFAMILSGYAQTRSVTGTVTDASTGETIIGATVSVDGTPRAATNVDGKFTLDLSATNTVSVAFMGYVTQQVRVGNNSTLTIKLVVDESLLDEVIVTGYTTSRRATLTGAISSITNQDIAVTKNENVVNMLAGKMPGVRISQQSSQPGEFKTRIDIRGMGDPLIVVDGIPRDQDYFSRMDANEVESISVLKDASAAIYGVRSANGVVLVTTKRGASAKTGKVDITYTANFGFQQFLYVPDIVGAVDYMNLKNEQVWSSLTNNYRNRRPANYSDADIADYANGIKTESNFMDATFDKTAPQSQHNLSVNGKTEKVSYFFNLGYMEQMGNYSSKSINYDRWNFRSNVDAKITDNLSAQFDVSGVMDEKNSPYGDIWAVYKQAWRQRPTIPIYVNDDPNYPNYEFIDSENPVIVTDSKVIGGRTDVQRTFDGAVALEYSVPWVQGLSAKARYTYTFKHRDYTYYTKAYYLYSWDDVNDEYIPHLKRAPSSILRQSQPQYSTLMQLSLKYNRTFNNTHRVSGLLLFEEAYRTWDDHQSFRELLVNSRYLSAGEDLRQRASMGSVGEGASRGLVGQFNYDYKGKYIFDGNFRYDASSKFPKESRWGLFAMASAAWRISEESFIKDNFSFIDNLKIRGSYGKLGDDRSAGNYPPIYTGYSIQPNYGYFIGGDLITGVEPTAFPNMNLTWFTSKTLNLGLDFDLWNGLFGAQIEYFIRKREGLMGTTGAIVPTVVGVSLPNENINNDQNAGTELVLTHRNRIGELAYNVSAQFSSTRIKRLDWMETAASNSYDFWRNRTANRYTEIWWAAEHGGRFTSYDQIYNHNVPGSIGQGANNGALPGDYYNVDWNNDGVINGDDNHPIATNNLPLVNYGISIGAVWKGFDLNMNFQGAAKVYTQLGEVLGEPLAFDGGAVTMFMDRWRPVDRMADLWDPTTQWIPGRYPITGHSTGNGEIRIENASYLRLKTLELGYNLPDKWISKVGIAGLRIYFSGYNLLTFTGLKHTDPEHPGGTGGNTSGSDGVYSYPINKTYNIGASIKF